MTHLFKVNDPGPKHPGSYLYAVRNDGALYRYRLDRTGKPGYAERVNVNVKGWTNLAVLDGNSRLTDGVDVPFGTKVLVGSVGGSLYGYALGEEGAYPLGRYGGYSVPIAGGWGNVVKMLAGHDVTGDNQADIVTIRKDGTLWLQEVVNGYGYGWNGGDPTMLSSTQLMLSQPRQIGHGWEAMSSVTLSGSTDANHSDDVVARRSDGALYSYRNLGGGKLSYPQKIGQNWNGMRLLGR